ncbi:MAG: hypothetical protein AB7F93_09870 [Immundisolibacter sp.]|uniref:hypothetical protein n=1 Tax=Immundisolibacter sp. TaxID=1934948 RepID=UPI003D108DE9
MDPIKRLQIPLSTIQAGVMPAGATGVETAAGRQADAPADWLTFYTRLLELEGYKPSADADGNLRIEHERWLICLCRDARDPEYFRLLLPNFWPVENDAERARAERAADRVNRQIKVAKVYSGSGRSMWVAVELFIAEPGYAAPILMRCIRLLPEAAMLFRAVMTTLDN